MSGDVNNLLGFVEPDDSDKHTNLSDLLTNEEINGRTLGEGTGDQSNLRYPFATSNNLENHGEFWSIIASLNEELRVGDQVLQDLYELLDGDQIEIILQDKDAGTKRVISEMLNAFLDISEQYGVLCDALPKVIGKKGIIPNTIYRPLMYLQVDLYKRAAEIMKALDMYKFDDEQ